MTFASKRLSFSMIMALSCVMITALVIMSHSNFSWLPSRVISASLENYDSESKPELNLISKLFKTQIEPNDLDESNLNILVVFGTRPEMIKLAPIIWQHQKVAEHIVMHCLFTNQHADLVNDGILTELKLNDCIDFYILNGVINNINVNGVDRLTYISSVMLQVTSAILQLYPLFDMIMVQGDTTSAMSASLSAFYHHTKICHIEAGLRTYLTSSPFPEELNRQLISKIATYHFTPSYYTRANLLNDNVEPDNIITVGNTVIDSIQWIYSNTRFKKEFNQYLLHHIKSSNPFLYQVIRDSKQYRLALFTMHRREKNAAVVLDILNAMLTILNTNSNLHIIYPIHPSQTLVFDWKKQKLITGTEMAMGRFHLIDPIKPTLLPFVYAILEFVITDSGGIQEEITFFNNKTENFFIPVFVIRDTTERVEIIQSKQAKLLGHDPQNIIHHINTYLQKTNTSNASLDFADAGDGDFNWYPYGQGDSSKKIFDYLISHQQQIKNLNFSKGKHLISHDPWRRDNEFQYINHLSFNITGFESVRNRWTGQLVAVLTIYRRPLELLKQQIKCLNESTIKPDYVILFQNEKHKNIYAGDDSAVNFNISELQEQLPFPLFHIHSKQMNTKYFGRFMIPILFATKYFIIFDDDVNFGSQWIENQLRVVNTYHALSTANGRIITSTNPTNPYKFKDVDVAKGIHPSDKQVDFGGHIWCGETEWLRILMRESPPFTEQTGEDVMISAVLWIHLGIPTVVPRVCNNEMRPDKWAHRKGNYAKFASFYILSRKGNYAKLRNAVIVYWIERRGWKILQDDQQLIAIEAQQCA